MARLLLALALFFLTMLPGTTGYAANVEDRNVNSSWTTVTIGVGDLDSAMTLWVDELGFELAEQRSGEDPELARLWNIQPGDISRQALLRTPGETTGMMHLVEFNDPAPPVRENAQAFDLCPKNLDIYARDLPQRHLELIAKGHTFRTKSYSEITAPNGIQFREIHMPSHDEINVVLLELIGAELPFSSQGFAGVGPLITIVGDAGAEKSFYKNIIGLELLSNNILEGEAIEKMIGLPPGSALDVSIWGELDSPLGQVEIIDYRGVEGNNLYLKARPKSLGILHISFVAQDLDKLTASLDHAGIEWTAHGTVSILPVAGRAIHFKSPAGLRIEVFSE